MSDQDRIHALAMANRLLAADMFAGLDERQWATPSLCEGWTVREVAAHLVPPVRGVSLPSLAMILVRYRGDLSRWVDETTQRAAGRPVEEIVAMLRDRADVRMEPPVTGAAGPMADTAIHLRDAARPLGLDGCPPPASWVPVLDFLVSRAAARGFVPRRRLPGLRLVVTDGSWSWGEGPEVVGAAEAVALAVAGRPATLPELRGRGVELLAHRLSA